jgi:HK97 family phage prohead protease
MLHKTLEATATAADLGEFSAIAATYTTDRQNERIRPGAFAKTIAAWQKSGKDIPLHWNHGSGAESIIGSVAPASMREVEAGLYVEGTLDILDSDVARQAWRSVKRNRIGLSFGFVVTSHRDLRGGVKELTGVDVFEVSLTPSPANSDTRILETKSLRSPIKLATFEV